MKIKDLVFDKNTCQLIGFTDLGEINNHLDNLDKQCSSNDTSSSVATHMLMLMVRGLCSCLEYPYAQFATRSITADSLFSIVWESVQCLESSGFRVISLTCNGASSNRKFSKCIKEVMNLLTRPKTDTLTMTGTFTSFVMYHTY